MTYPRGFSRPSGSTVTTALSITDKSLDPTLTDTRWTPSGMTEAGGGSYSSTRGAANAAALAAALAYAAAHKLTIQMPPGTWDIQGQIKFLSSIPTFRGSGVDNTTLRFQTGAGLTSGTVNSTTDSTTGYTVATSDGFGTGLMLGNNTGTYAGPGGVVSDLTISSASGNAPTYSGSPSTAVGLCINGITQMTIERVRVTKFGVGFDLINNCGGSEFRNVTTAYAECNFGAMMRTGGQSGSDISFFNAWLHGAYAGVCFDHSGGTDYHFYGGQIKANSSNALGLSAGNDSPAASTNDAIAGFIIGRNVLDGTIGADGIPGTLPTPGTGSVGLVTARNVDFEGTQHGWVVARSYVATSLVVESSNIIAYPLAGSSWGGNGCPGILKMTSAGKSMVRIVGNQVKGSYASTSLLQIANDTAGFDLVVEDNRGQQNTCINGYNSGNALTGNWLGVDVVSGAYTNLVRFSALSQAYRAASLGLIDLNGLFLENSSGQLKSSTDGTTFTTIPKVGTLVRRTSDNAKTSDASPATDSQLQFTAAASATYRVSGVLIYDGATTGDIQVNWTIPSGSLSGYFEGAVSTAANSTAQEVWTGQQGTGTKTLGAAGAGTKLYCDFDFIFLVGGTPGTIGLQWAQGTSDGTATTLYTNSFFIVEQLA